MFKVRLTESCRWRDAADERTLNGLGMVGVKRLFKDSSNAQRDFRPLSREDV